MHGNEKRSGMILILALSVAILAGCGSDSPDIQKPTGLSIDLGEGEVILGGEVEIEARWIYSRNNPAPPICDWYVNDVLGGDPATGTISQDNPATYEAPASLPAGARVEIEAVETAGGDGFSDADSLTLLTPIVLVEAEAGQIQVAETIQLSASLAADRSAEEFDWYVNGTLGGDAGSVGIISQDNPAIYAAPDQIPGEDPIEITAKWRDNPDIAGAAELRVLFTIKHVNASTGVDEAGGGRITAPFRTLTFANDPANTNQGDTILVAPGLYNQDLGEANSISTRYDVTIRGVDRDQCILEANPEHNGAIMYAGKVRLENLTFRNPDYPASEMKYAIQFQSPNGSAKNLRINDAFRNAAIYVTNTDVNPIIEDCVLVCTENPYLEFAVLCRDNTVPTLRNCVIDGWERGMTLPEGCQALVENCTITNNTIGVYVADAIGEADLGGGALGSLGGNTIQNNDYGVRNYSIFDISALFNVWTTNPPTEGPDTPCDFYSSNGGSVIWEE